MNRYAVPSALLHAETCPETMEIAANGIEAAHQHGQVLDQDDMLGLCVLLRRHAVALRQARRTADEILRDEATHATDQPLAAPVMPARLATNVVPFHQRPMIPEGV